MFLDDQLYEWVKLREIEKPKDFEELVNELYKIVEDYFKPKLKSDMTYKEGAALMDRVFKLWDMCIAKLEKENYMFIEALKSASYKKVFMNTPDLKKIYDKGK